MRELLRPPYSDTTQRPYHENSLVEYMQALGLEDPAHLTRFGIVTQADVDGLLIDADVLDLGSGATEKFAFQIGLAMMHSQKLITRSEVVTTRTLPEEIKAKVNVVSLNPEYRGSELRKQVQTERWLGKSVAAEASYLPFATGSFDTVVSLGAVTIYADPVQYSDYARLWLSEAMRVLKERGIAFFGPIYPNMVKQKGTVKAYRNLLQELYRSQPHTYSLKPLQGRDKATGKIANLMDNKNKGQVWGLAVQKI